MLELRLRPAAAFACRSGSFLRFHDGGGGPPAAVSPLKGRCAGRATEHDRACWFRRASRNAATDEAGAPIISPVDDEDDAVVADRFTGIKAVDTVDPRGLGALDALDDDDDGGSVAPSSTSVDIEWARECVAIFADGLRLLARLSRAAKSVREAGRASGSELRKLRLECAFASPAGPRESPVAVARPG